MMDPIRVGFLGIDQTVRFHLERLFLRDDFQIVTGVDLADGNRGESSRFGAISTDSPDTLLQTDGPELLLLGSTLDNPAQFIVEALRVGRSVIVEMPCPHHDWVDSVQTWISKQILQEPRFSPRLFVHTRHRWESTFRTLAPVIASGICGRFQRVIRISRQFVPRLKGMTTRPDTIDLGWKPAGVILAPPEDHLIPNNSTKSESHHALHSVNPPNNLIVGTDLPTVPETWMEFLDELLQIVSDKVVEVRGRYLQATWDSQSAKVGRECELRFQNGCIARLELHRMAFAPLETGWILEGTSAGFANSKTYRANSDTELVDAPVETIATDQNLFYDSIYDTLRGQKPFLVSWNSILETWRLAQQVEQVLNQQVEYSSFDVPT